MSRDKGDGTARRPRPLKRARVGSGPLRDLKDLLYEAYLAAGAPSLDGITADIAEDDGLPGAPSRDTVHRCLSSPDVPAAQADAVAIAAVLARQASWNEDELASRVRALWVQARMAEPLGQPISALTDPLVLEVHRAIEIGPEDPILIGRKDTVRELPLLPAYVERDHDQELCQKVAQAAAGASAIGVLVGGSSTGKTRACWEAVRPLPEGWRLWHPIAPGRAEAVLEELHGVGPRTVIWLNEMQHYLLTPASALGERVAAHLRALLQDPARTPVLVLGTIWPEYWTALTAQAAPAPDGIDPHAQARALLTGTGIVVGCSSPRGTFLISHRWSVVHDLPGCLSAADIPDQDMA
jgi:hypothetical protein